jgi:hypothetical protein
MGETAVRCILRLLQTIELQCTLWWEYNEKCTSLCNMVKTLHTLSFSLSEIHLISDIFSVRPIVIMAIYR